MLKKLKGARTMKGRKGSTIQQLTRGHAVERVGPTTARNKRRLAAKAAQKGHKPK